MAKKVEPPKSKAAIQAAKDDAAIIKPNHSVRLGGIDVLVREYPFFEYEEKIAQSPQAIELVEALSGLMSGGEVFWDDVLAILGSKGAAVRYLVGISIAQPEGFILSLDNSEIELLLMEWWMVNKHFFMKSVGRQLRAQKRLASQRDGQTSSSA